MRALLLRMIRGRRRSRAGAIRPMDPREQDLLDRMRAQRAARDARLDARIGAQPETRSKDPRP
jgi:hypothetical protein